MIKVESIGGDPYRQFGDEGIFAVKTTLGKSSICVDLKTPEGRTIAGQLCGLADVVVHNLRPGVPETLGLGADQLRDEHPQLIWASLNGYSRHSAAARRPATQTCAGAAAGGATYQAGQALMDPCESLDAVREIARQLMKANEVSPDSNTGAVLASAVTLALLARERYGVGQEVHVNMLAANMHANAADAVEYAGRPVRPEIDAGLHGTAALYRLYCTGDGWLFLAADSQREWTRTVEVLDSPELAADPRFASAADRAIHDAELAVEISSALSNRSAAEWERRFTEAGVAGVRADKDTPGEFLAHDEQVLGNGFAPLCQHARFGPHRRWGSIVTLEPGNESLGPGVLAGEQTVTLLAELGYAEVEIADMLQRKIVASEPCHPAVTADV